MKTIFIIGSGNSFDRSSIAVKMKGKFVIAINHEFEKYENTSWINAIFFKDYKFLKSMMKNDKWKDFKGIKMSSCSAQHRAARRKDFYGIYCFGSGKDFGIDTKRNKVAGKLCSGLTAINVAYHMGADNVILIGFDGGKGKTIYEDNANFVRQDADKIGLKIFNTSLESRITAFWKVNLKDFV
jgi:hypothetical protein